MGGRAQGRLERRVLPAHADGLRALRAQSLAGTLCDDGGVVRMRIDGQTDAGHDPVCSSVVGLLATRPLRAVVADGIQGSSLAPCLGKAAFARALGGVVHCHVHRAAGSNEFLRAITVGTADQ
jgi:hypothetical protein